MSEMSFEQMLEESFKTIRNGEVVEGTVIDVKPDEIFLNFKEKKVLTEERRTGNTLYCRGIFGFCWKKLLSHKNLNFFLSGRYRQNCQKRWKQSSRSLCLFAPCHQKLKKLSL